MCLMLFFKKSALFFLWDFLNPLCLYLCVSEHTVAGTPADMDLVEFHVVSQPGFLDFTFRFFNKYKRMQ